MRKLLLFLAIVMVCNFGVAFGAADQGNVYIVLDNITNTYGPSGDTIIAGKTHTFGIRYDVSQALPGNLFTGNTCHEVYSPDGADWGGLEAVGGPLVAQLSPATAVFLQHYEFNTAASPQRFIRTASQGTVPARGFVPVECEKAGFYLGITNSLGTDGWESAVDNDVAINATFTTRLEDDGLHMCIDSVNQQGIQAWEWGYGSQSPTALLWDNGHGDPGPRCYTIYNPPNKRPIWGGDGCVNAGYGGQVTNGNYSFNHCNTGTWTLCGFDQDSLPNLPPVITYLFAPGFETGYGTLDANTGVWTWEGATVPQSGNVDVQFQAFDGADTTEARFTLHVTLENTVPTIGCPVGQETISSGTEKSRNVTFADADDCDTPEIDSVHIDSGADPGDVVTFSGHLVTYHPAGAKRIVTMTVFVSDGDEQVSCTMEWNVIVGSPYQVYIEKHRDSYQGQYHSINIMLKTADAGVGAGLGAFDFLLAYDASALSFQLAEEGDIYDLCGWEYFTYRFGPDGVCGTGCPTGMLNVTGIAEKNDGPNHPNVACIHNGGGYLPEPEDLPVSLATLKFLVSNDRTLECNYVPVKFFWMECQDNVLSNFDGSKAYLSGHVFNFVEYDTYFEGGEMTGQDAFPTSMGDSLTLAYENCYYEDTVKHKFAIPAVDFQNGGFDIPCSELIDARGDINLNGLAYEIADAVMFTNYFVNGQGAFGTHYEGSVAASDCNADGVPLSVADLVYLIRVVIGDAPAIPKTSPIAAKFTVSGDTYGIDAEAGAAYLVFEGAVTPTLLADNMKMQYSVVNGNTNVLVFNDEVAGEAFSGSFLRANGRLISSEFATYEGQPMAAKLVPTSFAVEQNYPNPFNPTTNISFSIPNGGAWKLDIYNITGQLVQGFSGVSESGFETVTWDASGKASGIYFYKVTAGNNSETKKAVLLK